ncbi:hypothetical protein [Halorubrum saccharovorum]|uniref:hypothetical protein n=1 Tax=Halorubrum saccharovorum TaxID=2248 RepID=UPI001911206A|nr:hypothetical protein [Halorubrum saccharovorum]
MRAREWAVAAAFGDPTEYDVPALPTWRRRARRRPRPRVRGRRPRRTVHRGGATGSGAPMSARCRRPDEAADPAGATRLGTEATTTARARRRVWRTETTTRDSNGGSTDER